MAEEPTWRISQLNEWLNAVISTSLGGEIWVEGEITNLQRSAAGHVYFTLVERAEGEARSRTAPQTLSVTLFEWHRQNVNRHLKRSGGNVRMGDGVRVRIRGAVEIYGARSQLQLKMSGIDPVFTLGSLAAERARVLEALRSDGLLETNRSIETPVAPLRLALVTSVGSAAHADALDELVTSGVGFDVTVFDARVQGPEAPDSLIAALGEAELIDPDLILVVRGGGARTDLVAFDDEGVARAIATCPVAVWVGLGHETDRTVSDEVAHRSYKTPTACAQAVVATIVAAADAVEGTWVSLLDVVDTALTRTQQRLGLAAARVGQAVDADLRAGERALTAASIHLRTKTAAAFDQADRSHDLAQARLDRSSTDALASSTASLERIEALVRAYDPATTLARGWSITRTESGTLATAADLRAGDVVFTTLADGTIRSTINPKDNESS